MDSSDARRVVTVELPVGLNSTLKLTLPIVLSVLGIGKLKDGQTTDILTREISSPKSPAATGFDVSGMELVNVTSTIFPQTQRHL